MAFHGDPFDLVYLPHNLNATVLWTPDYSGTWLVDFTRILHFRVGFLDASGERTFSINAPDLSGALDGLAFFGQPLHLSTQGDVVLGSGSVAVFFDPRF